MTFDEMKKTEGYRRAVELKRQYGRMPFTAENHEAIGSTPSKILKANPGKSELELMTPEQLEEYFDRNLPEYKKILVEYVDRPDIRMLFKMDIFGAFRYCRDNDMLPEKYVDFNIEMAENETYEKPVEVVKEKKGMFSFLKFR